MEFEFNEKQKVNRVPFNEIPVGSFFTCDDPTDPKIPFKPYFKPSDTCGYSPRTKECYQYPAYFQNGRYYVLKLDAPIRLSLA